MPVKEIYFDLILTWYTNGLRILLTKATGDKIT